MAPSAASSMSPDVFRMHGCSGFAKVTLPRSFSHLRETALARGKARQRPMTPILVAMRRMRGRVGGNLRRRNQVNGNRRCRRKSLCRMLARVNP
jgi:hypothetical protein